MYERIAEISASPQQFQNQRSHQGHLVQYILSAWKVVQMSQTEFVDSQVYFDALVLKYLS